VDVILSTNRVILILVAAFGYSVATILMKLSAQSGSGLILAAIAMVLLGTALTEIVLLRQVDLGLAYIAILATETLIVVGFAAAIGEGLSTRDMVGGAMVLLGAMIVSA
jgi:hypothetical protein